MSNLGRNEHTLTLAKMLYSLENHNDLLILESYSNPNIVKLVDYSGNPGRKQFRIETECNDSKMNFTYKPIGFGLFAKGINYYAPNAVLTLLRFFTQKNSENISYLQSLNQSANGCGEVFLTNKITLTNHIELAFLIASLVLNEHADES